MAMDLRVRRAITEELPAISSILYYAVHAKMHHGDLNWGDKAYGSDELSAQITAGVVYVALLGDDIVGTFRMEWQDDGMWGAQPPIAGYVQRFAVASGYRGQRLGSRIFDLAAQVVERQGRQYVRLTCPIGNEKLRAYHESNGFLRADGKASPVHPAYAAAYYEKPVNEGVVMQSEQQSSSSDKKGVMRKIRGIHFGRSYN